MAYGRGDKPIPKFRAPRLPRPPEGPPARGGGRNPGTRPSVGRPPTKPPTTPPKPPSGKPPVKPTSPDDPYGAYIGELRKLKEEEIARQQKEADRIRQAYANYAAWLGALPGQIQSLYSNAAGDQAQFANGFSQGLRDAAAESAAEVNKMLADIGAPAGQQIAPSQGDQAGNVLYGVGGYIPAQALTTSGAAFGSAAAFMGPNAIKSGLLESQKYLTDNAKNLSDYDLEIAKLVGEQSKYRADQKAAKAKALHDDAVDLYNNGLITQREFARRLGLPNWRRYPNALKPGEAAGIDASASKLVGFLVDDNGNLIKDRKGKPIPIVHEQTRRTQVVGSDATGRKLIDLNTGQVIATISNPVKPTKKAKSAGAVSCYNTSAGIICLDAKGHVVPGTGSLNQGGGGPDPDFKKNASEARELATQAMRGRKIGKNITGTRDVYKPFESWQAAIDWMISEGADPAFAAWALWSKGGRKLKGAPKKKPPAPKANAAPSGGGDGRNASFSAGAPSMGGRIIGTPYSGTHTLGNWESDNAIDVALNYGTPLYAVEDGVIGPQFGSLGSGGRFAGLRLHLVSRGNEYYYAHLSRFAPGLRPGMRVKRGQLIGYSGAANGVNHLHFGMRHGDPRSLYGQRDSV